MQKRILCYAVALLFSSFLPSQEVTAVYSADKPIWDLRNFSGATDMSAQDDGTSQVFDLGFDFTFFGEPFNQAYMASNGCLILGQLATGNNWEKNCTQYEPSEAPNTNYTMYPFWTDLIMGGNSSMLAMQVDNKVIFGWYEMWEYYRDSKNTFELWLYPNNSYEARYSELDIKDHDVFIGIQGNENERETYYFHDKCFTGQVNSKECVSQDWNDTAINFDLENNGSILVGEALDCSNPLNDTSCAGYAAAYQTQQCDIDQLYNELCPYYSDAYDDFQCDLNPQYGPSCNGYKQEDSVAYFQEEVDYGYQDEQDYSNPFENQQEQFGYVEDPIETFEEPMFFEQQEQNFNEPEPYFEPIQTVENFEPRAEETFLPRENLMVEEFIFQETFLVENLPEPERIFEEVNEPIQEERIEEEFEPEPQELERVEEAKEEKLVEAEKEKVIEEVFPETKDGKSSITRDIALRVVSSTLTTASNSFNSGSQSSNNSLNGSTGGSSVSGDNMGVSNSPSISEQFAASTAQNNQVLEMSATSAADDAGSSSMTDSLVIDVNTETSNLNFNIDLAVTSDSKESDADKIADQILAQNLQDAQEQVAAQQEETGQYGSENAIIAVMGFLPGFNNYRMVSIPEKEFWYEPKSIYTNNTIADNNLAFYGLAGQSIKTLTALKELQPAL
jgi:hypothetical protein